MQPKQIEIISRWISFWPSRGSLKSQVYFPPNSRTSPTHNNSEHFAVLAFFTLITITKSFLSLRNGLAHSSAHITALKYLSLNQQRYLMIRTYRAIMREENMQAEQQREGNKKAKKTHFLALLGSIDWVQQTRCDCGCCWWLLNCCGWR